jgi:Flp pilus assembly protein TadD
MSVIADALKKAQRERMKRTSGAPGVVSAAPIIVRLRTSNGPAFSWGRALAVGVGAAVLIGLVAMVVQLRRVSVGAPLPAVPPPPVAERIVEATPRPAPPPTTAESEVAGSVPFGGVSVARTSPLPSRNGSGTAALDATSREVATPQGRPRDPGAAAARVRGIDGLRISVDRPRDVEYSRMFEQAVQAHRANDTSTARALYERLLSIAPDDPDLLNNFGVLLSSAREFDRAMDLLHRAVRLAPRNASAWTNLGYALREDGKPSQSIAAFQEALALDPRRPGVRVNIAQQYMALGSLAEARQAVDRLLADEPMSAEAHYTRGQLFELQGDRASAAREFADFLRFAPPRLAPYAQRVRQHLDSLGVKQPDE